MKTSELTGAALDWAVAKCEWVPLVLAFTGARNFVIRGQDMKPTIVMYEPSLYWAQGGPIIEREKLGLWFSEESVDDEGNPLGEAEWYCEACLTHYNADEIYRCMTGPTPLIAAMRCYVASKLGDEIELPEELK